MFVCWVSNNMSLTKYIFYFFFCRCRAWWRLWANHWVICLREGGSYPKKIRIWWVNSIEVVETVWGNWIWGRGVNFPLLFALSWLKDIVGEVFDAEDSVSVIKEEGPRAGRSKNIKNNLDTEIRLVILSTKKSKPVFLPVGSTQAVSFSSWNFSNKIELYT